MDRFIVDTDMASDDALALLMALGHPEVTVEAITCVAGYMPVERAAQNALYVLERAQRSDIPVYLGRATPLVKPFKQVSRSHGDDGLGDIGLPIGGRAVVPGNGVEKLVNLIGDNPGQLTLVTLGPLTNIATALLFEPAIASSYKMCHDGRQRQRHWQCHPCCGSKYMAGCRCSSHRFSIRYAAYNGWL